MAQRRVNLDDDPFADGDGGEDDIIARMLRDDEAQRQAHQKARVSFAAKLIKGGSDADDDDEGRLQPAEEDDDDVAPGQLIPLSKHSGKKKAPPAASSSLVRSQAKKGVKRAPPLPRPIAHSTTKEQSAVTSNNSNKSRKTEESIPAETPTPTSAPILNPAVAVSAKPKKRKASVPVKQQQQEEEKEEQPRHNTQEEKKHKEEVQEPVLFSLPVMAPLVALPVVVAAATQAAKDEKPLTQADRMDARLKKVTAFPSDEDVEKCGDWVMLALFAFKLTGAYFNCPPDRVSNYAAYSSEASYLFFRHLYARTQVAAAWIHLCEQSGNADMATIARMMPHCKLYIEAKSKVMAQDAVCVWSGETTNLHPVALVPIDEMCTWSLGSFIKEPGLQPIQFHIAAAFKDALKVWSHSYLFFFLASDPSTLRLLFSACTLCCLLLITFPFNWMPARRRPS